MASERWQQGLDRARVITLRLLSSCVALSLVACAGAPRFPPTEPLWQDTDRQPVEARCQLAPTPERPDHVACAPEVYVSPLAWDAADNSVFRPLAKLFAVDPAGEALNVNAFDEVPDSAWFENRLGKRHPTPIELLRGACTTDEMLDASSAAPGSWLIDKGKSNGASKGFRIRVPGSGKFMLKADIPEQPERPSAASAIGAAIYYAVGFNTSCEQIVSFDPQVLSLKPGLKVTDNSGITRDFDAAALSDVLKDATHYDANVRMQASAWLPGYLLGPFRYEGTRSDDPNDIIPHEERRDLRGARLLAAWLNHFDAREQNTMDSWISQNPELADSSPGFVRHYYLDTSDSFGSEWEDDGISRRLGRSYLLDFGDIGLDFITFGALTRPWEQASRTPGFEGFGYFHARDFDPEAWKNEYPNPAFSRASERDNAWMARILARFTRSDIAALTTLGKFSNPRHAAFLSDVLELRLKKILERYLTRLSPLTEPRLSGNQLCFTDLARTRALRAPEQFRYRAKLDSDGNSSRLQVSAAASGEVCVALPASGRRRGESDSHYWVVTLDNAVARYVLRAHVVDLGPRGLRLVGLSRPEERFE